MSNITQFDQLKADITLKVSPSLELKVADKDSMAVAQLAGKEAKHYAKLVEDKRKELVKPLNDQVTAINAYAKSIAEPLIQVEAHIKSQLIDYERKLDKERREEQARLDAERIRKEQELLKKQAEERERAEMERAFASPDTDGKELQRKEIIAAAAGNREQSELQREIRSEQKAIDSNRVSGTKRVWKFEIEAPEKVPRIFLSVNETQIRKAIADGVRDIPGVKIYEDIAIALR